MAKSPAMVVRVSANLQELRANLKEGRDQIEVTSASLRKLSNSFQGESLIHSAHGVTAAIQQVGVATLNTSESSRSLNLLDKAMDKLLRTGQEVPVEMSKTAAELRRMMRASDEADASVLRITANYRQFDGILQSAGIHIGPYVKGLEDVVAFTSKGVTGLGFFGAAAAVVATAVGAMKFGAAIGEWSGLRDEIARGTAVLMGYGDVAQQRALAIADSNDLAGKAEENQRRATAAVEANAKAIKDDSDAIRENWRITEGNADALARLSREIEANKEKKLADARATFAASQAQSVFGEETQRATDKVREQTAALDERALSMKRIADEATARKKQIDDFMNALTLSDRVAQSFTSDIPQLTGFALDDVIARFHQAGDRTDDQALERALATMESQEGRRKATDNETFFQLQRDQVLLEQLRQMFDRRSFANGVENFSGGLAYVHQNELLVNMAPGTSVIPASHAMGGTTVNISVSLSGVVGSKQEIADYIGKIMMDKLRGQGFRAPVGA